VNPKRGRRRVTGDNQQEIPSKNEYTFGDERGGTKDMRKHHVVLIRGRLQAGREKRTAKRRRVQARPPALEERGRIIPGPAENKQDGHTS